MAAWLDLLVASALAQATPWPSLSTPPQSGGGSKDAAVVVAIQDYSFVSDIPGASQNGLDWYSYLTKGRGVPTGQVKLLVDRQAKKEEIEAALAEMAQVVQPGGTLWFVFIGHGAPAADGQDGLLLGSDADQTPRSVYARGMRQSDLFALMAKGRQGQTVAILDACFSGQDAGGEALVAGLQPLVPTYAAPTGGATVLSAGRSDEFAGPLPGLDRPAFSYLALGALRGWGDADHDQQVTAQEAVDYATNAMRGLLVGRSQTPALQGSNNPVLGAGSEQGPDIAEIRAALVGPAPNGGADLEQRQAALAEKQAQAEQLTSEAARLQREIDAEVSRQQAAVQAEARAAWASVQALAQEGGEPGKQALWAFVKEYGAKQITAGKQSYPVAVAEVEQAQAWLERYGQAPEGSKTWQGQSGYAMVRIDPGTFQMGLEEDGEYQEDDEDPHEVTLSRPYYLGTVEVTQGLWQTVMAGNPAAFPSCGADCPVEQISWCDAVVFANHLSRLDGLEAAYRLPSGFLLGMSDERCDELAAEVVWDREANGYRLPTEAEWEHAARAGTALKYPGSENPKEVAWYFSTSDEETHPVAQLKANAWGLYDMGGNVWEWCWDWYGSYPDDPIADPQGPEEGSHRVQRGGSWGRKAPALRVANRGHEAPSTSGDYLGLRLARSL